VPSFSGRGGGGTELRKKMVCFIFKRERALRERKGKGKAEGKSGLFPYQERGGIRREKENA